MCVYGASKEFRERQIEKRKQAYDKLVRRALEVSKKEGVSLTSAMYIVAMEDLTSDK